MKHSTLKFSSKKVFYFIANVNFPIGNKQLREHEKQKSDVVTVTYSNTNTRDMQPNQCYRYVEYLLDFISCNSMYLIVTFEAVISYRKKFPCYSNCCNKCYRVTS